MSKTTRLRYEGAASLTYRDSDGVRRTVLRGQEFDADEKTAEALTSSDPTVVKVTGTTTVQHVTTTVESTTSTTGSHPGATAEDLEALNVTQLRERLTSAGLDSGGTKAVLVDRLTTYGAGQAAAASAGANAVTLGASSNPAAPDPSSSEAEPVPPPPEGGTLPVPGPTVPSIGPDTGAIRLSDIPEGGKTPSDKHSSKP